MKTVLTFREGQSGNFFKHLLENSQVTMSFRTKDFHPTNYFNLTLTHQVDYNYHCKHFDQILRILPSKKIYLAIYNNFMKKLIKEQTNDNFDDWISCPIKWYDVCYSNITEYYDLIDYDISANQYRNIIDFDQMLNLEYLNMILKKYFLTEMDESRQKILETYNKLQLQIDLDTVTTSMQSIVDPIPDELFASNPWFFSYCVFKFEKTNKFVETQRKWSINDLKGVQTKKDCLNIAQTY
jgi:hypothetical protein